MAQKKIKKTTTSTDRLTCALTEIIAETNGITLGDTLELIIAAPPEQLQKKDVQIIRDFYKLLLQFQIDQADIHDLLEHPFSQALRGFFSNFPLTFREEHTHLTGALDGEFVYPRLEKALHGKHGDSIRDTISAVYGIRPSSLRSMSSVDKLLRIQKNEAFDEYLQKLVLPKLLLTSRQDHADAAYHMASKMYHQYNVGAIRLKFTYSRVNSSGSASETIPGASKLSSDDVVLGLYEGFDRFRKEVPSFEFILSPCFRKEEDYFDAQNYSSKGDHVLHQVNEMLELIDRHPELADHVKEVDTVGNERDFYRKSHFGEMQQAFRKLQFRGFRIRSHHGETWHRFRHGIQAVDNAMNIWHIDALEHGVSMGVNPNYYFHRLYQRVLEMNKKGKTINPTSPEGYELLDMNWGSHQAIRDKLISGERLSASDIVAFTKVKFHTAREIEHYQHDVLNRLINKDISLMSLPSSNYKLTSRFGDYKDHPFSWWEKKGIRLGIGTDNYVTLDTDFIQEMMIILYTDPNQLKITKLLMVATGEKRRPFMSSVLWNHHKAINKM